MDLGLEDANALVTASTSGLGLASATALAAEGANVAICGRTDERLDAAVEQVDAAGSGDVLGVQADLTVRDDVEALVEETVSAFGGLDHLVTSAGGVPSTTFDTTTDEQWYAAYDTLVMSVVWTLDEALPHLTDDGGSVVCITSRTVQEVGDGLLLSNSVRRGVVGLVKTVAREYAPAVRANTVLPGNFETARMTELIEAGVDRGDFADYDSGLAAFSEEIPLERLGDPSELGDVVAFLSSERASYVNGAEVPIDGAVLRS